MDKQAASKSTKVMVWYLINLLLLPGIGFLVVCACYYQYVKSKQADWVIDYARQACIASLIGGGLIISVSTLLYFSVADPMTSWPMIILFFTVAHSIFILWGILNVARAMAAKVVAPLGFDI